MSFTETTGASKGCHLNHAEEEAYGGEWGHLLADGACDCLAHPPVRIGGELEAAVGVKLLHATPKAAHALGQQVLEVQPPVHVAPRHMEHQPLIALHHARPRLVPRLHRAHACTVGAYSSSEGRHSIVSVRAEMASVQ